MTKDYVTLDILTGSMLWESEEHSPFMTPLAKTEKQFCLGRTTSQQLLLTLRSDKYEAKAD